MQKRNLLKIALITSVATFTMLNHYKAIKQNKQIRLQHIKNIEFKYKTDKEIYKEWHDINIKALKEKEAKELAEKQKVEELKKQKEESEWIPVRLSFYTNDHSDCGKTDGISASGKHLNRGGNFIAAPHDIPFGTKLYIKELDDVYTVEDRGGAIVWRDGIMCLDVYIPNVSQSYLNKLGVKYSRVKIIK